MISQMRQVLLFLMLILSPTIVYSAELKSFRSNEHSIVFLYPSNWKIEAARMSSTVAKVVSPDNALAFNVNIDKDKALINMPPAVFVKKFTISGINKTYKPMFPKFALVNAGETTLMNQPAYFLIYTCEYSSLGYQQPWKTITVFTNRSGVQYSLTAGGLPAVFDDNYELLMSIIRSFTIMEQ